MAEGGGVNCVCCGMECGTLCDVVRGRAWAAARRENNVVVEVVRDVV